MADVPASPEWFDPARDQLLTPQALRGLVHPIRLRLLDLLQADGPATATGPLTDACCAARTRPRPQERDL